MARRVSAALGLLLLAVVFGTTVALIPIWMSAGQDIDPAGETCWIEVDPGSGPSAIGVERRHGGIAPYTECVPVAENPGVVQDDTFAAEAERALAGESMPISDATRAAAEESLAHPLYQRLWPVFAAFASVVFAIAFAIVASAVAKRRTDDRSELDAGLTL